MPTTSQTEYSIHKYNNKEYSYLSSKGRLCLVIVGDWVQEIVAESVDHHENNLRNVDEKERLINRCIQEG